MQSSYDREEKNSRCRYYHTKSIFSCDTTFTVQKVLQLAAYTNLQVSSENYEH